MIDKEFIVAINIIDKTATLNDSGIIFHPFEINDTDHISPLCEKDPDLYFYNSIDFHLSKCNYYKESSFAPIVSNLVNLSQPLSLCHLNIRSIKKSLSHDDIIKWKHFPHYWPFVWAIHRSAVKSPHKGQ